MALSDQEKQALREIEESLLADDPKFRAQVSGEGGGFGSGRVTLKGVALVVFGLVLLVGGVALAQGSTWFIILSIVGFVVMFGASVWMLRGGGSGDDSFSGGGKGRSSKNSGSGGSSLGGRMEENFRRRFER